MPATAVCRLSLDPTCDPEELCDGVGVACPGDTQDPDGSTCNDGDAATVGETCTTGLCGCLGPDLDGDLIPDVCDPADVAISRLKKVVAWQTRSKQARIKAKGTIQAGTLDASAGFSFAFADALDMDVSAAVSGTDCQTSSRGRIKCVSADRTVRATFKPTSTAGEFKFKIFLQKLSFVGPQAGPITIAITENATSLDHAGSFTNCRLSRASLMCQ